MSVIAVKIKVMPTSPEVNLEELQNRIKTLLESEGVQNTQFETEPIAFGLKAIIAMFGWPEEKELENLESELAKVENVNSVELLDIRRAIG